MSIHPLPLICFSIRFDRHFHRLANREVMIFGAFLFLFEWPCQRDRLFLF